MKNVSIKIARADDLPGFAAYLAGTVHREGQTTIDLGENQGLVLLNVEANFDDSSLEDENGEDVSFTVEEKKRNLIASLMHEFGHSLEDFFRLEFDEDWIERVVESWESKGD